MNRWHRWFAWYPVRSILNPHRLLWLTTVERIRFDGKWLHQEFGWNT